jgi:hypothetical protein
MFTENKYSKCYFRIIENRQRNPLDGYVEKHHIIPKSLGGTNKKSNIIALSAREHFLCHRLLVKMTTGKDKVKMAYAIRAMMRLENPYQDRYKITSKLYESLVKITKPIIGRSLMGDQNPFFNKKHTEVSKARMREKRKLQVMPSGWSHTDKTKDKLREANAKQFKDPVQREMRREASLKQLSNPVKRFEAGNGSRGTKWCHNPTTGQRMKYRIKLPNGYINGPGVIKRNPRKKSGKSWYNNPITGENKQFVPGTEPGEFVRGRIINKKGGAL